MTADEVLALHLARATELVLEAARGCRWENYDGAGECGLPLSVHARKGRDYCDEHLTLVTADEAADDEYKSDRDAELFND